MGDWLKRNLGRDKDKDAEAETGHTHSWSAWVTASAAWQETRSCSSCGAEQTRNR